MIASDLRAGKTPVIYLHPWDFDAEGRAVEAGALNRFIGNIQVGASWDRLRRLLVRYETRTLLSLNDALAAGFPRDSQTTRETA